jgi:hypothetical protein
LATPSTTLCWANTASAPAVPTPPALGEQGHARRLAEEGGTVLVAAAVSAWISKAAA